MRYFPTLFKLHFGGLVACLAVLLWNAYASGLILGAALLGPLLILFGLLRSGPGFWRHLRMLLGKLGRGFYWFLGAGYVFLVTCSYVTHAGSLADKTLFAAVGVLLVTWVMTLLLLSLTSIECSLDPKYGV